MFELQQCRPHSGRAQICLRNGGKYDYHFILRTCAKLKSRCQAL